MREIGIRELKRRASDVVREVAAGTEVYTVTRRGKPVGVLVPPDYISGQARTKDVDAWGHLLCLADKLASERGTRTSAVRELSGMRR